MNRTDPHSIENPFNAYEGGDLLAPLFQLDHADEANREGIAHGRTAPSGSPVRSVLKALDILDCLALANRPLSLQELSTALGWPKSTLHGLLSALRLRGFVDQRAVDSRYFLGSRLVELSNQVTEGWEILDRAGPLMRQLAATSGETVILVRRSRDTALVVDRVEPGGPNLQVSLPPGSHLPLYCTAVGKVLLAYATPSDREAYLASTPLLPHTPHTYTNRTELRQQLGHILNQQFAIEDGEYRIGLRSVAAPILDSRGCPYTIGILGLFRRTNTDPFRQSAELVRAAAKQLSQWLKLQ